MRKKHAILALATALAALLAFFVILLREVQTGPASQPPPKPQAASPHLGSAHEPAPAAEIVETEKEASYSPPAAPSEEEMKDASDISISGRVDDESGEPLPSAEVFLLVYAPAKKDLDPLMNERLATARWFSDQADKEGRFTISGISLVGSAVLGASKPGYEGSTLNVELESGKSMEEMAIALKHGKPLRGTVVTGELKPVANAVVSVYHSWNAKDYLASFSMTRTDAKGRFELGLNEKTERCDLRVNSDAYGQDFFLDLALDENDLRLVLKAPGTVRGTITWEGGAAAEGLVVCLTLAVPEPDVLQRYTGLRQHHQIEAVVGSSGQYELSGLAAGLDCDIFVVSWGTDKNPVGWTYLTPQWQNRFRLAAGEVKVWDRAVERPILITGHVYTERTRAPVPGMKIGVEKNGKLIPYFEMRCDTDQEGAYTLQLLSGPGSYRVFPLPGSGNDAIGELSAKAYAKTLSLGGGEKAELDLDVFEPVVLPVRVLSSDGHPVESIQATLSIKLSSGQRYGFGSSYQLDSEGRMSFPLHYPVAELSLEVSDFPEGPRVRTEIFTPLAGMALPEVVLTLPRAAGIKGSLLDSAGNPRAGILTTLAAEYADGSSESFYCQTDPSGSFAKKACLRQESLKLTIQFDGAAEPWKSDWLDASRSSELELGRITVASK